ncbi:hypothetical protein [Micromonospora sp. NPDC049102]|uniref:hypothetical protein n=1 Tax=Micromonospora sp. NPDC049102 TaxID=3364265 RepID=UPI00371B6903
MPAEVHDATPAPGLHLVHTAPALDGLAVVARTLLTQPLSVVARMVDAPPASVAAALTLDGAIARTGTLGLPVLVTGNALAGAGSDRVLPIDIHGRPATPDTAEYVLVLPAVHLFAKHPSIAGTGADLDLPAVLAGEDRDVVAVATSFPGPPVPAGIVPDVRDALAPVLRLRGGATQGDRLRSLPAAGARRIASRPDRATFEQLRRYIETAASESARQAGKHLSPTLTAAFGLELEIPGVTVPFRSRGEVLAFGPGWRLEPDNVPGSTNTGDLEFVLSPMSSLTDGRAATREIIALVAEIRRIALDSPNREVILSAAATPLSSITLARDTVLLVGDINFGAKLQAAYGIGLPQISGAVDRLLSKAQSRAIHRATQMVAQMHETRFSKPLSRSAEGFVELINMYRSRAAHTGPRQGGSVHSLFGLMARSDFTSIYERLLDDADRRDIRRLLLPEAAGAVPLFMEALSLDIADRVFKQASKGVPAPSLANHSALIHTRLQRLAALRSPDLKIVTDVNNILLVNHIPQMPAAILEAADRLRVRDRPERAASLLVEHFSNEYGTQRLRGVATLGDRIRETLGQTDSRGGLFRNSGETDAVRVSRTVHLVDALTPSHTAAAPTPVTEPATSVTELIRQSNLSVLRTADSYAVIPSRFADDDAARAAYPWLAGVNPDHSSTNCVLTAIVSDMNAGSSDFDWVAGTADPEHEAHLVNYQRQELGLPQDAIPPVYRTNVEAARAAMQAAPLGSRAILLVRDPALEALGAMSHAFNVLHDEHGVVFLDGQQGGRARIPTYAGEQFLLPLTAHIPAPAGAETVDPGVLDEAAAGLGIEAEREAIVVPVKRTDSKLVATWRPTADGPVLMYTKLDKRSYFERIDGYLAGKTDRPQNGDGKRLRFPIIEDVTHPTLVYPDGDVGRPEWQQVSRELEAITERLDQAPLWRRGSIGEGAAIEKIYPPEAGWEINEDFQNARVLIARPNKGDYIQWNVGVPLGDGVDLVRWLLKEGRIYQPVSRDILREGIKFGGLIAAHYLDVNPADVDRYRYEPGVAEIWDFMTHVYTHASAVSFHVYGDFPETSGLLKNRLAIALRNPLAAVRAALPAPARGYLEYAATKIKRQWVKIRGASLRARHPSDSWTPALRSGNLLDHAIPGATNFSIGDYLDNALLARPTQRFRQHDVLGINSGARRSEFEQLDNNDGRMKDVAVYEIRHLLDGALSHEQMNAVQLELVNRLRNTRKAREAYERGEGLPPGTGPAERAPWIKLANDLAYLVEALHQPEWRDNLEPVGRELLKRISWPLGTLTSGLGHQGWQKALTAVGGQQLRGLRESLWRTHAGDDRLSGILERIDQIALQSASIAALQSGRQRDLARDAVDLLPEAAQPNASPDSLLRLLAEHPAETNRKLAESPSHERTLTSAILSELTSPTWGRTFVMLPAATAKRLVDGERFLLRGQHEDFNVIPAGYAVVVVDSFSRVPADSQPELRFILPADGLIALKQSWPNVAHFRYDHPTQVATLERLLPDGMLEDALLPPGIRRSERVYWVGHVPSEETEAEIREASKDFDGPVIFLGAYRRGAEAAPRHVHDARHLAQLFALKRQQPIVVTNAKISPALHALSATYGLSILHPVIRPAKTSEGLANLNLDIFWRLTGGNGTDTELSTTFAAWFFTSAAKSVKLAKNTPNWAVGGLLLAPNKAAKLESLAEFGKQLTKESAVNELAEIVKRVDDDPWFRKFTPLLGEIGKHGKAEFVLDFQELGGEDPTNRTRLLIGERGHMIDAGLREKLIEDSFGEHEARGAATALHAVDLVVTGRTAAALQYVKDHSHRLYSAEKQHWVNAIHDLSKAHPDRASDLYALATEVLNCRPDPVQE